MTGIGEVFVAAFRPHVEARLAGLGVSVDDELSDAVDQGETWLSSALEALEATEPERQRRGPLELFQAAMEAPTAVLAARGMAPIERDEVVANALPGDLFGLAPASSQALGEQAWQAHLSWGAAKAATSHSSPPTRRSSPPTRRIGLLSRNLMDSSKLDAALAAAGFERVKVSPDSPESVEVAVIDLEHPAALDVIAKMTATRVIAYGPHVDTELMEAAGALDAETMPRSKVLRDPRAFVETL